jgi:hypothetical protein
MKQRLSFWAPFVAALKKWDNQSFCCSSETCQIFSDKKKFLLARKVLTRDLKTFFQKNVFRFKKNFRS